MELIDSYMKEHYTGYYFIIECSDGTKINDDAMELNLKHLYEFDYLTMDKHAFDAYLSSVLSRYNYSLFDIKSVHIGYKRPRIDLPIVYSLVKDNPYIQNVIEYVKNKDIYGVNNYKTIQYIISSECPNYQEMKDYLFHELKKNSSVFLNRYFTSSKNFHQQLYNYSDLVNSSFKSEEEVKEENRLKDKISEELSIYKIYRSMAVKRNYYESIDNKLIERRNSKPSITKTDIHRMNDTDFNKYLDNIEKDLKKHQIRSDKDQSELEKYIDKVSTDEAKTDSYNQEHDEYLEPNEYDQMTGYTGERVK